MVEDTTAIGTAEGEYVCDPEIEDCDAPAEWKNTIELDYNTPNLIVGVVTLANFILPVLLYRFWFNVSRTAAEQTVYNDQSKY